MKINPSRNRAFTLIEMLVVIAIIAILTGIVIANLTNSKSRARDAKRVSDLGQIQLALGLYFDRCRQYPYNLDTGQNSGCPPTISLASYISTIPQDPRGGFYDYKINATSPTPPTDFVLHATLESPNAAQQNSMPESTRLSSAYSSWATGFNCYVPGPGSSNSYDYCLTSK